MGELHGQSLPQKKVGGGEEDGRHGRARVSLQLHGHPKKTLARRSGAVGSCKGENKEEGAVTGEASRGGVQGQGRGNARARRRQGLG